MGPDVSVRWKKLPIVGNSFGAQVVRFCCTMNLNGCDADMLCGWQDPSTVAPLGVRKPIGHQESSEVLGWKSSF
ncbi:Uncharacterized protein HZ326_11932 [Fusarium oxysporum f. sp. albedinis]|nr:Uncharacterized protein HZ326_11932 [Fusarium oxysporum f. sp. albedinis]